MSPCSLDAAGNASDAIGAYNRGDTFGAIVSGVGALGGIAQFGSSCFAAGTPIVTPDGSRTIDELGVGDWVLSLPEDAPEGTPEPRRVVNVMRNFAPLLDLRVGGRVIRTTAEHPFWVVGHGWRAAHQLVPGDVLMSVEKRPVVLEGVVRDQAAATVYNVEVEGYPGSAQTSMLMR